MRRQRNCTQGRLFTVHVVYFETIRRNECYLLVIITQSPPDGKDMVNRFLIKLMLNRILGGLNTSFLTV